VSEDRRLVSVAIAVPVRRLFTYRVPETLEGEIRPGVRVRVPFGRRRVEGTVVEVGVAEPETGRELLDLESVLDDGPELDPPLLFLTRFVADYYLCSWGEAIESALPPRVRRRPRREAIGEPGEPAPALSPTKAQEAVLAEILPAVHRRAYAPFLLFGATGSGKTEVYLRAAEAALAKGRGVLYLVPEIGLTPLLLSRLARRLPGPIAVLHSAMPAGERRDAWERVRSGECRVVVGARSAVFAPVPELGLLVVDEEHDGSYKQEERPRYHARDVAVVRARNEGAVLVLGSATPSLESFHHARAGRYRLLRLGGRVEQRPLPAVRIVDMRREYRETGAVRPVSRALEKAVAEALGRGEQALILRNRRGWAKALLCPACGVRIGCPRCSLSLTWHREPGRLRCHLCGIERPRPGACPACGQPELREVGEGTERIEDELRRLFPEARIGRMDRDTVRRRGVQERLLRQFDRGDLDILVGTQMIAKGHDFPRVTLVGVLSADHTLGLPDFRAAERTFQLLTQMAGRAGRGDRPGEVIVQAFDSGHPVLREAAAQDYEAFYEREMGFRRALRYPPVSGLVRLLVVGKEPSKARAWAQLVAEALEQAGENKLVLSGPGPAPVERIRGMYREQILVRSAGRRRLVEAVSRALELVERKVPRRAVHVDVDPLSVL